jgi:bifunctional DNA-binding transcriptional regulator/antitoxin component of YhaV-PrlF toxin-antitoxin module
MDKNKAVHKLKKINRYSYGVTIPKEIVEKYGWREKQKLTIIDKGRGKIEISDWKRR